MSEIKSGGDRNINYNFTYNSNVDKLKNDQQVIKDLKAANESLRDTIHSLNQDLSDMQSRYDEATSSEVWRQNAEKIERYNELIRHSYQETIAFLESHHLDSVVYNDERGAEILSEIRQGYKTAGEAISEYKSIFREMIEETSRSSGGMFDTQQVQSFTASLNTLGDTINKVLAEITSMKENGVKSISDTATGSGGAGLAGVFEGIGIASADMSSGAKEAYQPVLNLVEAIAHYNSVDTEKIQAISSAFRSVAAATSNTLGGKTTDNVIKMITQLQAVTQGKPIDIIMNVKGIEDLKVRKTSLNNLATYLPAIAKVNVNKLKELSNVDLTNFNNIKVSKGAVEEISKIADAIQILKEAKAASVNVNGGGITIDKTVSQALAEQKALEKEVTAATKEWEASQRAAAEQAAQVVTPLQQQINALTGVDRAAKDAKSSWEHMNFEMKEQAEDAKAAAKEINETIKYQKKATSLLVEMTKAKKNWTKARGGQTAEQYANIQKMIPELDTLMKDFRNGDVLLPDFKARIDQLSTSFGENSTQIKAAGENTLSFGDRVQKLSGKFGAWLSITRIIMGVIRTIKQMIKTVVEIDSAMTQLQIVTKATSDTMRGFASNAAKSAKEIGSTITDFTSSVTTFARLGYNLDESSALAKYTAMLQNVGDIDVSDAQDSITSIIKAFNISTDQIESTMDKLVVTGNHFPISVSQIAEGMTNASSTLAAAGNTFEQSVALLTAANTTIKLCRVA